MDKFARNVSAFAWVLAAAIGLSLVAPTAAAQDFEENEQSAAWTEVAFGQADAKDRTLFGQTETGRWIFGCRQDSISNGHLFELIDPLTGATSYEWPIPEGDSPCGGDNDYKIYAESSNQWLFVATSDEVLAFHNLRLEWRRELGSSGLWQLMLLPDNALIAVNTFERAAGTPGIHAIDAVSGELRASGTSVPSVGLGGRLQRSAQGVSAFGVAGIWAWDADLNSAAPIPSAFLTGSIGTGQNYGYVKFPSNGGCSVDAAIADPNGALLHQRRIESPLSGCGHYAAGATPSGGLTYVAVDSATNEGYWHLLDSELTTVREGSLASFAGISGPANPTHELYVDRSGATVTSIQMPTLCPDGASGCTLPFALVLNADGSSDLVAMTSSTTSSIEELVISSGTILAVERIDCVQPCDSRPTVARPATGCSATLASQNQ